VADIDLDLRVQWLGDATMRIWARVTNNESGLYEGHLRVYVTEILSTLGWNDSTGHPYTYPFLDYAFNGPIAIPAGGVWQGSVDWDGHLHGDGMGNTYGGITYDNVTVLGAVFDDEKHQGYSDPPNGAPYDAYYVDEAAGAIPDALVVDEHTFSTATGGRMNFSFYAGSENALRNYLLVGGTSGTDPGTLLPGGQAVIPINRDWFTDMIIYNLHQPVFADFFGALDGSGTAEAVLDGGPQSPQWVGTRVHFAFALTNPWDFASNPVVVEIVP